MQPLLAEDTDCQTVTVEIPNAKQQQIYSVYDVTQQLYIRKVHMLFVSILSIRMLKVSANVDRAMLASTLRKQMRH